MATTDKKASHSSELVKNLRIQVNEKLVVISILSVYSQMMTYKADKANFHGVNMDYRTSTLKIYVILQAI